MKILTTQSLFEENPEFEENGFYIDSFDETLTLSRDDYYKINSEKLNELFSKIQNFNGQINIPGFWIKGENISLNINNKTLTASTLIIYACFGENHIKYKLNIDIVKDVKKIDLAHYNLYESKYIWNIYFENCFFVNGVPLAHLNLYNCTFNNCIITNLQDIYKEYTNYNGHIKFQANNKYINCTDSTNTAFPNIYVK